jgi:hypothetical protein
MDDITPTLSVGLLVIVCSVMPSVWHSRYRYAAEYGVAPYKVIVETEPHDCDFLGAPFGRKYCHYEPGSRDCALGNVNRGKADDAF